MVDVIIGEGGSLCLFAGVSNLIQLVNVRLIHLQDCWGAAYHVGCVVPLCMFNLFFVFVSVFEFPLLRFYSLFIFAFHLIPGDGCWIG